VGIFRSQLHECLVQTLYGLFVLFKGQHYEFVEVDGLVVVVVHVTEYFRALAFGFTRSARQKYAQPLFQLLEVNEPIFV